ncbi:MAG: tannase/feruloyl esterase family alpha/beta hydrolase [Antricoccus sp.]
MLGKIPRYRVTLPLVVAAALTASMLSFLGGSSAQAGAPPTACQQLMTSTGNDEAPAKVTEAKVVPATGSVPAYCDVQAVVGSTIGYEVRLPVRSGWNSKMLFIGCGGACGFLPLSAASDVYLADGYVTATTDMGHQGGALDFSFAHNNRQAEIDFGYRATHLSTVFTKVIIAQYYGRPEKLAYFRGGSTGGRQALVEAQRYPADYNGIIAIAPATNETSLGVLHLLWSALSNLDANGNNILTATQAELLNKAAIKQCDGADGLKDGIIGNALTCRFDPAAIQCPRHHNGAANCLTREQVVAARKIYGGPVNSAGKHLDAGGVLPGSELNWIGTYISPANGTPSQYLQFGESFAKNAAFETDLPSSWTAKDFNWNTDPQKLAYMEQFYSGTNGDLTAFRDLGGKLIMYNGLADQSVPPSYPLAYYTKARRMMGGELASSKFFRYFVLPGVNHVQGGVGADTIDSVAYINRWVTRNVAPNVMIGSHIVNGKVQFTRPYFPYPCQTRYNKGNPNSARSFVPAGQCAVIGR